MSGNDEVGPENAHFLQGLSLQLILTKIIPLLTFSRISRSLHLSNIIKFNFKSKVQSASPTKYQRFFLRVAHLPFFYYYIHMKDKLIPVTLLTGYLGAGKTTLMNYILNNQTGYKVAVIVNDIGEVNIDAALIEKGAGIVEEEKDSIVPLQNGCICCSLKTDLIEQIVSLTKQNKFDYILIEASGICEPQPIAETIDALSGPPEGYQEMLAAGEVEEWDLPVVAKLDTIVAVVDAARMVSEFGGGNSLLKKDLEEHDIEALLVQQIEFCNTVLINKTDLVTPEELEQVRQVVRALQPKARLIETSRSQVDLSLILGTNSFSFDNVFTSAGWLNALNQFEEEQKHHHEHHHHDEECGCGHHHHDHNEECGCGHHHHHDHDEECECGHHHHHDGKCCCGHDHHHSHTEEFGISTFVYFRRRPFDRMKLDDFAQNWPKTVIRTKGIMWLSDDNASAFVLEQAGHQIDAGYSGDWMATGTKAQIKATMEADPEFKRNWDERVGDRMIKLVFIGKDMNKDKIIADLDACLVEPRL